MIFFILSARYIFLFEIHTKLVFIEVTVNSILPKLGIVCKNVTNRKVLIIFGHIVTIVYFYITYISTKLHNTVESVHSCCSLYCCIINHYSRKLLKHLFVLKSFTCIEQLQLLLSYNNFLYTSFVINEI